jgi:hypothetical protein
MDARLASRQFAKGASESIAGIFGSSGERQNWVISQQEWL